jgi:hypothetical protein
MVHQRHSKTNTNRYRGARKTRDSMKKGASKNKQDIKIAAFNIINGRVGNLEVALQAIEKM